MAEHPIMDNPKTAAVVVAGGMGLRLGGDVPKQYQDLCGKPVLAHAIEAFTSHPDIDLVQVVIGSDDRALFDTMTLPKESVLDPVYGGASRQGSVKNGLRALEAHRPERVLIHDGARPFLSGDLISRLLTALEDSDGAFLAIPVADTLRRKNEKSAGLETIDRTDLWQAQTPQAFDYAAILKAHEEANGDETDDVALAERAGLNVKLVEGSRRNFKITTVADIEMARQLFDTQQARNTETRVGYGYDVHRFENGDAVTLAGVSIPHTQKLKGHSDADVVLHALTDALLGAIGEGDIGDHFPPSDKKWKDASSEIFVHHAMALLGQRGGRLVNADITLICEAPKIGPHRQAMRASLSRILDADVSRISIKATTTEKLGFTGRGEGIAAEAVVSAELTKGI